jgi:hypothetical protein
MTDMDFIVAPAEQVFRPKRAAGNNPALWMAGGIAMLGLAVVGFVAALYSRVDLMTLQMMTTLPALIGIGGIAGARSMAGTPSEVGVGPAGMRVVNREGEKRYGWDSVGWCKVDATPMNSRKMLTVFDTAGKPLLRIADTLNGFDALVEAVKANIAAKPDSTAAKIQTTKAKRQAVFMGLGGIAFLAVSIAVAMMTSQEIRADRLLKTSAVQGTARIERRFLAPNGVTPRLEYRVTTDDGNSGTRNAEVERAYWDSLEGVRSVPVVYVPGEPSVSRLLAGEVDEKDSFKNPIIGYGLPAVVGALSLGFLVGAVLSWRGWDIDLDSKTGKLSIKRFGEGR